MFTPVMFTNVAYRLTRAHLIRPTLLRPALALACAALLASGCSSLRSIAGLDKDAPDEFQVVQRAPLSMPPDFGLRAPDPGAPRPQEVTPTDRARQIVIDRQVAPGESTLQPIEGLSVGETALLKQAGAASADPNIRREVNRETATLADADKRWIDSLLFWKKAQPAGSVVDPEKESARLRENAALNRPVTTGETPTIKKKSSALFEF
jgi:hypothetical protein